MSKLSFIVEARGEQFLVYRSRAEIGQPLETLASVACEAAAWCVDGHGMPAITTLTVSGPWDATDLQQRGREAAYLLCDAYNADGECWQPRPLRPVATHDRTGMEAELDRIAAKLESETVH